MMKNHRRVFVNLAVILVVTALLTGCFAGPRPGASKPSAAATVKRSLELSTDFVDDGVDAIGARLKVIPITQVERRRPLIKALAVLEKIRKINDMTARWAGYTAQSGQVPDPELLAAYHRRRMELIQSITDVVIALGIDVYKPTIQ